MDSNITVLKFGSSVLRSDADLPGVVHEIYRYWRRGSQVLVVVSAMGNATDDLQTRAEQLSVEPHAKSLAALLATGEATSAALLGLALDRAGIPVEILSPRQAGLRTSGPTLDAEPVDLDDQKLRESLATSVVVVSGFVGIDENDEPTLLGRGGSDLTALFLAERLSARCVLLKDVDGLYESDPNDAFVRPHRFARANWRTCIDLGTSVVQSKAVRFAEEHELEFSISALGSRSATLIGGADDEIATEVYDPSPLKVALLGCGTVGGGVYQALSSRARHFEVVGVADRNRDKAIAAGVPVELITDDAHELIERKCDVVVELFGGVTLTHRIVQHAIDLGRHVVTANKALLAEHVAELEAAAGPNGTSLRYSAAVGGAMPALESITSRSDVVESFTGIVNGTCNFICDELTRGVDFATGVRAAQAAGFAEADPTLDISGTDAAQKLILLARAAFGVDLSIDQIDRVGITELDPDSIGAARARGNVVRLVVECRKTADGIEASVGPREFTLTHPFASANGAENRLLIETESGETISVSGRGAGRWPTTEAVIADLFDLYRESTSHPRHLPAAAAGQLTSTEAYV
jgi:homoserine dehydrogenase